MAKPPYLGRSLLALMLWLPALFQLVAFAAIFVTVLLLEAFSFREPTALIVASTVVGLLILFWCFRSGRNTIRKLSPASPVEGATEQPGADLKIPPTFAARYLPVLLAFGYTLSITLVALLLPAPTTGAVFGPAVNAIFVTHLPSTFIIGMGMMIGAPALWPLLLPPLGIYVGYGLGLARGFREKGIPRAPLPGKLASLTIIVLVLGAIAWRAEFMTRDIIRGSRATWYAENTFNRDHHPFQEGNRLVRIAAPGLLIAHDHPRLDGATALYPVYAAAAQAIYQNTNQTSIQKIVTTSTTPDAYERLVAGDTDLVFVAQPSNEQRARAGAAGRPLQLTPIAREAFVFFVHADNPVDGLTSDQIRAIYTKKIVNWKEVGGRDEPIIPFQRPAGSGSQTALELKVMRGEKPATPLREEFALGMGGVIQRVAAYQNSSRAIGYSFRVYATALTPEKEVKFLAVDGVAPTRETIRAATYPYTVDIYAATAGTNNPHVPALLAWFLSPQGQRLIDETGYVSLTPSP